MGVPPGCLEAIVVRKTFLLLSALAFAIGSVAAPALAAKKKSGSFSASGVPFPGPDGCNGSHGAVEGVSVTSETFKAPFNGFLTVTMSGFEGDWDLFLNDADGNEMMSSTESQLQGAPPTEEVLFPLKKKTEVMMSACNWVGGPSATVDWEFVGTK